jgi:hypothetical protein
MAIGKKADLMYNLIDECGGMPDNGSAIILENLIRWMSGDELERFVNDFRREHEMLDQGDIIEYEENYYEICMDCQETYHIDEDHTCETTTPPLGESTYFSSLIPEC